MTGIYLKMKGGATVEIVEQTVYHSRRHSFGGHSSFGSFDSFHHSHSHVITNSFKNSENYLALESFLVADGHTVLTVGDGEFSYPFMVQLPPRLVSSFGRAGASLAYRSNDSRGEGDVTYHLEAGMKLVGREDLVMSKPISIHAILDLTTLPEASLVGEVEESKTFRRICFCLGCQSNPLSVKVRIPKMGYLPGETISFQVEVNNQSGKVY
ncbi:Arrestin domain-containing protein 3 [Orchesella cincta]|uniref:Arrestin domain-containing protein 3 n=1 Tax=Orchesella cincta TaxID=48709 RepID=A0A1D2MCZ2_ORCCI|nr:Arrestin domain-containing protein 3 [Orchesella cincta]